MEPTTLEHATAEAVVDDSSESVVADEFDATSSLVEDDLLVEEISIDGMCGVY